MPEWLAITISVGCWLAALQQVRMYLVYTGRIISPTLGQMDGGPALRGIAIRSAMSLTVYGVLVLLIPWPRLITYVSLVWLCQQIVAAIVGIKILPPRITEEGKRRRNIVELGALIVRAAIFVACAFIWGF